MIDARICAAGLLLLSTGIAAAAPARVETDLNVRSGEGAGFPVIAVMPAGTVIDASGCGDGWCYISEYNGFASAAYLNVAGASLAPVYVGPPAAVVVPGPVYRGYYDPPGPRIIRRGIREFRRDLRHDRRQDRREVRQELRQDRREARQERRERQDRRRD